MIVGRALAAAALSIAACSAAVAQENAEAVPSRPAPVRYSYILAGELAGSYERTALPDRTYRLRLEYANGRGSSLVESVAAFDEQWYPLRLETTGHDGAGRDASETFAIENGVARWKNRAEQGSAPSRPLRFYSSSTSPLDETRALVLAARASRDGCVDLLPTGRACVRKALEDRVAAGGREQTVHAWAISGVGFRPVIVWLDEQSELFATVSSWASAIRQGWEPAEETLLEKQEAWIAGELRRRAQASMRKPAGPFVIRNAKLFDSVSGDVRAGMSVLVSGKRILQVATDEELRAEGAETIDAGGAMLLPGLWDMHVHDLPADGLLALASGVTTVRSLGGRSESLVPMRSKFESGEVAGPRLMFHGLIDGRNGSGGVSGELVADAPGVARAVATYLEAGADGIKIYSAVPPALIPRIVDEAHSRGLAAGGHVPTGMSVQDAVRSGFDEISHLWSIIAAFEAPMPDAETPAGKKEMMRRLTSFDVMAPAVQAFLRQLRVRHVTIDPTIGSFEDSLADGGIVNGEDPAHGDPIAAHLPPAVRRSAAARHQVRTVDGATRMVAIQQLRSLLMELWRHGVSLVLGGDGLPRPRPSARNGRMGGERRPEFRDPAGGHPRQCPRGRPREVPRQHPAGKTRRHGPRRRQPGREHPRHREGAAHHQGRDRLRASQAPREPRRRAMTPAA